MAILWISIGNVYKRHYATSTAARGIPRTAVLSGMRYTSSVYPSVILVIQGLAQVHCLAGHRSRID